MTLSEPEMTARIGQFHDLLRSYGPVAIAYSGGVDSALVAKLAYDAMRSSPRLPSPVAVMAVSPSLARGEYEAARELAGEIGIFFVTVQTRETELSAYRQNAPDRCYYCKSTLYSTIEKLQSEYGFKTILNGTNADDLSDHRPGLTAAREYEVRSPLAELGVTKNQVREMAKLLGLKVWDKPATPCLSSRIVYGLEVTPARLERVDAAERFLKQLTGIKILRVRHQQGDVARIEVPGEEIERLQKPDVWQTIQRELGSLGFASVTLDPRGFRSGSLNEGLGKVVKSSFGS